MMLSTSASPPMMVKSSLEEMLDSLRQRDESETDNKPKDAPPALPSRPASRARLPSARKSVPINFKVVSDGDGNGGVVVKDDVKRKEKELGSGRVGSFGSKKIRKGNCVECPYVEGRDRGCGSKVGVFLGGSELELEDNVEYFTSKQLRVWCRLLDGRWVSGRIQSSTGEEAVVSLSNGNASPLIVKISTGDLLPANPDLLEGVNDLIQLSYLNEPSVLHNIRYRFLKNKIYSKAGPLLIAVNPFKEIPLYGSDFVTAYRQNLMSSPHVFATAGAAYNQMMKDNRNQSIIISGESGAGKTESAKFAMQYLATLGNGGGGMEYGVLHSNYILEAFGNAKTVRNNNSSRFGKLIDILFNDLGKICGAKIQTFLLEKSRVVQLANGERSYHVFYQLCAGASSPLKDRLNLKKVSDYYYLNQSESLDINGVDDASKFKTLVDSLDILQIQKEDQENVFTILATVLWLGNISFQVIDSENHVKVLSDEAVTTVGRLMGCSPQELVTVLSTHKIQAGRDSIVKSLTLQQAIDTRDALAKFIYGSLFDWLVEQMNKSLERGKEDARKCISILDIYGFESFKKNSFEQFCINYANERLQQHFNRHLLKLEQEEYDADGIDWTKVDFVDNEECLNLIEKKPLGILSLLDEESNFPRATNLTFANKLKQHLGANPCFKGDRGRAFGVCHYAGEVRYDTNGFLEKNRDPLHSELIHFISSCSSRLLRYFASRMLEQSQHQVIASSLGGCDTQKSSVGTKFKDQLFELMHHLEKTTPHFIRCIKPNSRQLPGKYEEDLVLQQLKCCGVLEVVRISRSGYPTRISHQEFSERYGFLLMQSTVSQDPLSTSIAILKQFNVLPEMYQVGFTRLYLRTGQIGLLEDKRNQFLQCVIAVQKHFRGYRVRCHFFELKDGVTKFQSFVRGENARRKCPIEPTRSDEQKKAVIRLQSVIRGMLARKELRKMPNLRRSNVGVMKYQTNPDGIVSEVKVIPEEQVQSLPSVVEELQRRVLKAETVIEQKEKENAVLREQLELSEKRWREYEDKMKTMEDIWQKQMASLQTSLAAARKTLAADNAAGQPGRHDATSPPFYYDSEDAISTVSQTPGAWTPVKLPNGILDGVGAGGDTSTLNAVNNLVREFEQQKQAFDDDARSLGAKSEQSLVAINPHEELIKLKHRFEAWKKEYKFRLRETKARLYKLRNSESERSRRRWWGKISTKAS